MVRGDLHDCVSVNKEHQSEFFAVLVFNSEEGIGQYLFR